MNTLYTQAEQPTFDSAFHDAFAFLCGEAQKALDEATAAVRDLRHFFMPILPTFSTLGV